MTEFFKEQFFQFSAMFYLGTALFFLYNLLKRYIERCRVSPKIAGCQTILFFLFAGVLTCGMLEFLTFGQLGWYTGLGFLLGYPMAKALYQ